MNPGGSPLKPKPHKDPDDRGDELVDSGSSNELPCGGRLDCNQTPKDYFFSQISFYRDDVCSAFYFDPWMCDPRNWQAPITPMILDFSFAFNIDYSSNAIVSQDLATAFSVAGATVEIVSTVAGCVAGSEAGIAPGCAAGYATGHAFHTAVTNPMEQRFSFISLGATIKANGNWTSESSVTALATWGAGQASSDGVVDAIIDIYASGYSHGWFCGINTFPNCFP